MEIRVLKNYMVVARLRNITTAATVLNISQPALSTQIKHLEEELGKQLLIRSGRGDKRLSLTEEGRILCKRAEEILTLVTRTEDEIRQPEDTISGTVSIGAGETKAMEIAAKAAYHLRSKYPRIRFELTSGNAQLITDYLDKGLLDIGLVLCEPDRTRFSFIPLDVPDRWGILMPSDSPLAQQDDIQPADVLDLPLIVSRQEGESETLQTLLQAEYEHLDIVATYNLAHNAAQLVREGLGYAICYDSLVNTDDPTLCFRPFQDQPVIPGFFIWKQERLFSRAAAAYLNELKQLMEENRTAEQAARKQR